MRKRKTVNEILEKHKDGMPLERMMQAMEQAYEAGGAIAAFPFAKECAPYLHPKRQPVDDKGSARVVVERVLFGGEPDGE